MQQKSAPLPWAVWCAAVYGQVLQVVVVTVVVVVAAGYLKPEAVRI